MFKNSYHFSTKCILFLFSMLLFIVVAPEISYAVQYNYSNLDGRLSSVVNDNGSIIIYSYDNNGNLTSKNLLKKPAVQAPPEVNLLDDSYVVYAYGIKKDALNVTFPTWTDYNGNDDLAYPWVPGEKVSDGIWKAVVPLNKHNNETGLYYNDVWVDGVYFGGSHTLVKRNNVQIPEKVNFKDGSYEVIVQGIREDVSKVTFYTWTETKGQDDLKQSNGLKISAGVWKVTIPLSEHNYETGIYTTHIYTTDLYGNSTGIGVQTELTKSVQAPTEANLLDDSYVVYAYGIKKDALNVTFPTWTDYNGNDDLAYPWVPGEKVSDGIWKAIVPFSKHNNETGLYYNDVWVDGVYFGGSHTLVKRNNVQIPEKVNFKDGSYEVIVQGIREDVSKVTFYTWTETKGQDDLKQSNGQKISAGVWKVTIPLSEHNYETGIYTTHIYTTDLYGNSTGIGVKTEVVN